jgi:uncharacterized membrane protein
MHLFLLPVSFTISLVLFRIFYSGSLMYIFFVWNLFLACVPFVVSTILVQIHSPKMKWLLFSCWLLFFPNALYIITDLVHLKERYPVPLWFDIILIFSAIINGLIMAFISLQQIEVFLRSTFNKSKTNMILCGCLFLSSFGIYLGRFLRMNSWDILSNPLVLIEQIGQRFIDPFEHPRTWSMTIVLTAFFTIFYFIIKKLPSLIIKEKY